NPPSIDPGVMAFIWALLLAVFIYFGLLAIGAKGAFAIVISLLAFAAIWLFVRLRGEDRSRAERAAPGKREDEQTGERRPERRVQPLPRVRGRGVETRAMSGEKLEPASATNGVHPAPGIGRPRRGC